MRSVPAFAAALLLFGLTASRTVQGGDAGEWMTLAVQPGVGHAPGYPLFTLWLRAWGALPWGEVAHRASLATAVLGAATIGLVHRAVDRWTGDAVAAWAAAGLLATTGAFWRYATVAEVFAPAACVAAALVCLAVEIESGWRGERAALALGAVLGIGAAHHHTVILLAPLVVWAAWRLERRRGLLVALVPLASYLLLLDGAHLWGRLDSLGDVLHHVLRRDYGTFSLSGSQADVAWWAHPLHFLLRLGGEWMGLGAFVGLGGLGLAARAGLGRALALAFLLVGPIFLMAFDVPAEGLGLVVAERFHVVPFVLFAVGVGLGVARLGRWGWPLIPLIPLSGAAHHTVGSHAEWTLLDSYLRQVLDEVPADGVLLVQGDSTIYGLRYAQQVLELRPDVLVVSPTLLEHPGYLPSVRRPERPGLTALVESFDRPVCLTFELSRGERLPAPQVGGLLVHLQPTDAVPPPVPDVPPALIDRSWEAAVLFEYRAAASLKPEQR